MDTTTVDQSGGNDALPSNLFIAIISSVGGIIAIISIIMICTFIYMCCQEFHKRKLVNRKEGDRVGLLRSKGEDDITSDQFEDEGAQSCSDNGNNVPLTERSSSGSYKESKPSSLFLSSNSNKVTPASVEAASDEPRSNGVKKRVVAGKGNVGEREEEEENIVCTMIEGSDDDSEGGSNDRDKGDELNAQIDSNEDSQQLVKAKKKSSPPQKVMDVQTKAKILGRSVYYVEELSKSSPLNGQSIAELSEMASDTSNPIIQEYKGVPSNSVPSLNLSPAEMAKNRYRNVLPNPHSAVPLKDVGSEGSTYINANFIRGLHGEEKTYIATQGPISDTVPDFWRMVWEHNVPIIVMLTNLIESGRHKCVRYWPILNDDSKQQITYGNIEVSNNHEERVLSSYTLSHLTIKNLETGEKRDVHHFWYTAWPDFGIPKSTAPILELRAAVDRYRGSDSNPIIVHCSAGLGRSGTFMSIDMGIEQYKEEEVADPLKYLCEMRQDRGGMIQTQDQYLFVHKALAEHMK